MNRALTTTLVLLLSQSAFAADDYYYQCSKDSRVKYIAVDYGSSSTAVPCGVMYTKKGNTTELWHADKQEGYCESKAKTFVDNQVTKGWQCTKKEGEIPD
jgi:hypothetical protein